MVIKHESSLIDNKSESLTTSSGNHLTFLLKIVLLYTSRKSVNYNIVQNYLRQKIVLKHKLAIVRVVLKFLDLCYSSQCSMLVHRYE